MSEPTIKDAEVVESPEVMKAKAFVQAYGKLVEEHQMDLATYPVFIPDGNGGFKVIVQSTPMDISKLPKKSPFMGS